MVSAGVSACKVVGRLDNHNRVLEDIRLVKDNLNIAMSCKTREEYFEKVIIPNNYKEYCASYSCYYPDVREKKIWN